MFRQVFIVGTGILAAAAVAGAGARAQAACPTRITDAAIKAHPGALIVSCKSEEEDGKLQYQVRVKSGKTVLELDVAPDGTLLQTEEEVELASVPGQVISAFSMRYPKSKAILAEKQTMANGKVTYELMFHREGKRKDATFDEAGKFLEEE